MNDYEMIQELRKRGLANGSSLGSHSGFMDEVADRLEFLCKRNKELCDNNIIQKGLLDAYAASARSIKLNLKEFCEEEVPYPKMIADAARMASDRLAAYNNIYVCKCSFILDLYDDDGHLLSGNSIVVERGDIYKLIDSSDRVIDGEIHLERIDDSEGHQWLEISKETLANNFICIGQVI